MRVSQKCILAVLCLVVFPTVFLYPEGTKQVMPNANAKGQLCINKSRNNFGFNDAEPEFRLNITIANTSEKIRFGFGPVLGSGGGVVSDLEYRIKGPAGNIVKSQAPVPSAGPGFINTHAEALKGPFAGGYSYLEFSPPGPGTYSLEFYYPSDNGSGVYVNDNNRRYIEFFDITVVNTAGNEVSGRVWSKAWQFWSDADPFNGKMMILSDDSIVTQVNCNGFKGGSFSFSSNGTGCGSTGNLASDRKSRTGFHTDPKYKVFLNDPDSTLFPTQKVTSGILQPITVTTSCTTGGADFDIRVIKDGTIRLLIEINPSPGADPEDVQIIANVKAVPEFSDHNIITWDGNDGYGRPVTSGKTLSFSVTNLSGLTHLPLYDIENNDFGYVVKQIRPAGGQLRIYWDDTNIAGGTANTTNGCTSSSGCHTWSFGNNNTINSWWFVSWAEIVGTPFVTKRPPALPVLNGNRVHCEGTGTLEFSVVSDPNSTSYTWHYSETGVTITETGTKATLHFAADAKPGMLSVTGHNEGCGNGPESSAEIIFEALPVVVSPSFSDLCYTAPAFSLTGGEPQGGTYFVHTMEADSIFPYKEPEGWLPIEYAYTSPTGCSNSDTSGILLTSGADCLGAVYFPNAFTPDGDSLNDEFRPVVRNISTFKMYVYSRWGQLIYSTDDAAKGWDGTLDGKACPEGTYTFTATYGLSRREDNMETKRGVFGLIR